MGSVAGLAHAGSSAVQITPDGKVDKAIRVTIPSYLPATAACSEHLAVAAAMKVVNWIPQIVSDCASVVRSSKDFAWATSWRRPFAGVWRTFRDEEGAPRMPNISKTKAHREENDDMTSDDLYEFRGNAVADREAREAAVVDPPPS